MARTRRAAAGMGRNDVRRYAGVSQDWKVGCGALAREREVPRLPLAFKTRQMEALILGKGNGKGPVW